MQTDTNAPAVSVVVTCYNHEQFVTLCLNSIKSQSFKDYELIIVDDFSTDDSVRIISAWIIENRIQAKFIVHEKNIGLCQTLNEALQYTRGAYFAHISADDLWGSEKLQLHVNSFLNSDDNVAVVYSDVTHIDTVGKILLRSHLENSFPLQEPASGKIFPLLSKRNFIPAIGATIKTSALKSLGGYDERLRYEDYDMWLRISQSYEFQYCPGTVAAWRIVATSMSHTELQTHKPASSYTEFLISEKCLRISNLSPVLRDIWVRRQWDAAYWLYYYGDKRAGPCLWVCFLHNKKAKTFALLVAAIMGISRLRQTIKK